MTERLNNNHPNTLLCQETRTGVSYCLWSLLGGSQPRLSGVALQSTESPEAGEPVSTRSHSLFFQPLTQKSSPRPLVATCGRLATSSSVECGYRECRGRCRVMHVTERRLGPPFPSGRLRSEAITLDRKGTEQ